MISDTPTLPFKSPRKTNLMAKAFNQFNLCSTYAKHGFFSVIPAAFLNQLIFVFTFTNIFGFFSWTEFGPSILGVQYTLIDFLSRENSSVNSCKKHSENINDG